MTTFWPKPARRHFEDLRGIVHKVAARAKIAPIEECLKWGQPAWRPHKNGIGTTLRAAWHPAHPDHFALFVHCQTTLGETLKTLYPDTFQFQGNRALRWSLDAPMPKDAIEHCALLTLTYYRKAS
ncbi:MAG: DUF1801 domain-containing protein [Sulfitobacter sp.]